MAKYVGFIVKFRFPKIILGAKKSLSQLTTELIDKGYSTIGLPKISNEEFKEFILNGVFIEGLGFPKEKITAQDIEGLIKCVEADENQLKIRNYLSEFMSRKSLVGWSTHGHTGVDGNFKRLKEISFNLTN